jgi:hypothetical protein
MGKRNRRGEWICSCAAYRFPHRFGGGKCDGSWIPVETWEGNYGGRSPCRDCNSNVQGRCEVADGRESVTVCEAWLEFVDFNEIKLGKKWLR